MLFILEVSSAESATEVETTYSTSKITDIRIFRDKGSSNRPRIPTQANDFIQCQYSSDGFKINWPANTLPANVQITNISSEEILLNITLISQETIPIELNHGDYCVRVKLHDGTNYIGNFSL